LGVWVWLVGLDFAGAAGVVLDCANRPTDANIEAKISFFISILLFSGGMLSNHPHEPIMRLNGSLYDPVDRPCFLAPVG
jgi:hypothetical protein